MSQLEKLANIVRKYDGIEELATAIESINEELSEDVTLEEFSDSLEDYV